MQYSICKCELHILRFHAYGEVLVGYGVPREIISTIWDCSCKPWASCDLPNSPKICNFIYYFHPKLIALRWTTLHPQQCGEWDSYVRKHGMVQYFKQLKKIVKCIDIVFNCYLLQAVFQDLLFILRVNLWIIQIYITMYNINF